MYKPQLLEKLRIVKLAKTNGDDHIIPKLREELKELLEVLDTPRNHSTIEEVADVIIMLQQYIYHYRVVSPLRFWINYKLARTLKIFKERR